MNLFEINTEIREALNCILESADENGLIDDALVEKLAALRETQENKIEAIALYIKEKKAESEALKAEAKKLAERAQIADNAVERLKVYLITGMNEAGVEKFNTSKVALSFRKSSAVIVDDIELIPDEFIKIEKKANKTELKKAISQHTITGAHIEEKQSLIIK